MQPSDPDWEARVRADEKIRFQTRENEQLKSYAVGCLSIIGIIVFVAYSPLIIAVLVLVIGGVVVWAIVKTIYDTIVESARQRRQHRLQTRLAAVEADPERLAVYRTVLDQLEPGWRETGQAGIDHINQALDAAEADNG